jgi:hypothetical protein
VSLTNPVLPVVGVPLLLLIVLVWTMRYWSRERRKVWGAVAGALGLSYRTSQLTPVLAGTYRGRSVRLDQVTQRSGRTVYTRVVVGLARGPGGRLSLSPQAAPVNLVAKYFGAQDVELGDPPFDARFMVKSEPQSFALNVLAEAGVREKLLAERAPFLVEMDGHALRFEIGDCCETADDRMRHIAVDTDRVRALLDLACDFAAAVDAQGAPTLTAGAPSPADLGRVARRSTASYAGAAFSLLLALFLTYVGIVKWSVARRSRGVVAVVVKSEVAPGGRPEITYRYAAGGSTYESPLFPHLGDGLDDEQARALVRSHPAGQRLTVYYDYTEPSRSVLYPPTSPPLGVFLALVWVMSGLFVFFALRGT